MTNADITRWKNDRKMDYGKCQDKAQQKDVN